MVETHFSEKEDFFASGATLEYKFRVGKLRQLKKAIKFHEEEILSALKSDLGKPGFEAFTSEIGLVYQEINHVLDHLHDWMQPEISDAPIVHFPSSTRVEKVPLGVVLIIAPWNYPFMLVMSPLVAAIAAGNTVLIKPSEFTPATSEIAQKIISEYFDPNYMSIVTGDGQEVVSSIMAQHRFDHIFFTGSTQVGSVIAQNAAKKLIPVTLELGGKSPTIICEDANITLAARRVMWGKFFNAGQTCIAPDYVLVSEAVKSKFIKACKTALTDFYQDSTKNSEDYAKIVNIKQFKRLTSLLDGNYNLIAGGNRDEEQLWIEPTLVTDLELEHPLMENEIFGPILPIISFRGLDEAKEIITRNPYPLALYLFTRSSKIEEELMNAVRFGGGCVNNCLVHLADDNIPFGGVGYSGQGNYHGIDGFRTFTHRRSIMKTANWLDMPIRYPKFADWKLKVVRWLMR